MTTLSSEELLARKDDWLNRVARLIDEVEAWAGVEGWVIAKSDASIHEEALGTYSLTALRIHLPAGELHLTPIGLHIVGGDGRVDLEAWPTLNRVKLIGNNGQWEILTDSNVPLRIPWSRETFVQLAKDLLK
jgi:hypothetical protein